MQWEQDDIYTPETEKPDWTEEDWEIFFQEQDRRAEHFQKKFEEAYLKYKEQYTDYEELSKRIQSDLNQDYPIINSHWLEIAEESEREHLQRESWETPNSNFNIDMVQTDFESLPVYQHSLKFALDTPRYVKSFYDKGLDTPEVHQLHFHGYQIAAHIAGGHALGYDKDGLTGNIAKLKRALKSAHLCLEALLVIKRKHLSSEENLEYLIQNIIKVRDTLIHHIVELRKKVWW